MQEAIVWLIIFSLIAVWFVIGYKICKSDPIKEYDKKRTKEYKKFIKSAAWKKIESLTPIPYTPESGDSDTGGEDGY